MESASRFEIILGCMFSGKTEEILRRVRRAQIAEQKVVCFKPSLDTRDKKKLKTRNGDSLPAFVIDVESPQKIIKKSQDSQVVVIDELQFFNYDIVEVVRELVASGKRVIGAGLESDFKGNPFCPVPELIVEAHPHFRTFLTAVCMVCRIEEADRNQRLIDGQPAPADSPLILPGGSKSGDLYEPRCRKCFIRPV